MYINYRCRDCGKIISIQNAPHEVRYRYYVNRSVHKNCVTKIVYEADANFMYTVCDLVSISHEVHPNAVDVKELEEPAPPKSHNNIDPDDPRMQFCYKPEPDPEEEV